MLVLQIFTTFILLLNSSTISASQIRSNRKLAAEEFGELHNRVCLQVRDRFAEKTPETRAEAYRYLTEELLTLCDDDDIECQLRLHEAAVNGKFDKVEDINSDTIIDDIMPFTLDDMDLKNTFKDIHSMIGLLDSMSPEDVIYEINSISEGYKLLEMNEQKQYLVESTASIASASTELWTRIFADPDDAFNKFYISNLEKSFIDHGHRTLEEEVSEEVASEEMSIITTTSMVTVIRADFMSSVRGVVFPVVLSTITGNLSISISIIAKIIIDSVKAYFEISFREILGLPPKPTRPPRPTLSPVALPQFSSFFPPP